MKSKITRSGLLTILKRMADPTDFTVCVETDPKLRTTDNPLAHRVTKRTSMLVRIHEDYEKAVNDARLEEGVRPTFKAKERAWGTHVEGTPLVEHKESYYLSCRVLDSAEPVYYVDGEEANDRQRRVIQVFLPTKPESSGRQKVEDEVVVRTFKIESIVAIQIEKDGEWLYVK